MQGRVLAIAAALMLASCGRTPAPTSTPASTAADVVATAPTDAHPVMGPERHILAFGDSLFAGYRVPQGASYPAKLEAALRARGVNVRVANAGVPGDTSAAGLYRLKFTLDNQPQPPDLVLVEFGGNDLLRALPPDEISANLGAMLEALQRRHITALLVGIKAPPNLGEDYRRQFDAIYPALAKSAQVPLVPFFLEQVYDKPDLLQDDHMHPTARGIEEIVGVTVDEVEKALPQAKQ